MSISEAVQLVIQASSIFQKVEMFLFGYGAAIKNI